jgi:hypothetical protein
VPIWNWLLTTPPRTASGCRGLQPQEISAFVRTLSASARERYWSSSRPTRPLRREFPNGCRPPEGSSGRCHPDYRAQQRTLKAHRQRRMLRLSTGRASSLPGTAYSQRTDLSEIFAEHSLSKLILFGESSLRRALTELRIIIRNAIIKVRQLIALPCLGNVESRRAARRPASILCRGPPEYFDDTGTTSTPFSACGVLRYPPDRFS